MDKEIKKEIENLRSELNQHNHNYYVLNSPTISDKDFDFLLKKLEQLEQDYPEFDDPLSPTHRVGSDLSTGFEKVAHTRPMISLSNTYSPEEVSEWFNRLKSGLGNADFQIVGELKFDGTSISLHYSNGKLVKAVTRGDGEFGDDVTSNVKTIKSIPLQLLNRDWPDEFEIRGEILMPWKSFEQLNEERQKNGEQLFANPRNAASGTIKMLNSKEVANRNLDVRLYSLLGDNLPFDNHYDNLQKAREWGFKVSESMQILNTSDDVNAFISHWDEARKSLPVATDGLVFKINSLNQQLNLGSTAKSPRWAIAYKFNPENACTRLKFVSFETGRMGVITPVANLEPVLLSGTIVKRASLHNEDIIRQLDIHEDDWVYVEKGGEIIPKITGVELSKRIQETKPIKFVSHCPVCNTPLKRIEGETAWVCPNQYGCRPQITGKIQHFAARKMMNIDGIGEETAEMLYDTGLVKSIADIYSLTADKLSVLDRMGEKSANRIIQGIEDSKKVPFERVVYALSIPNVGETTAKRIAKYVKNIDNLISSTVEKLTQIPDVGETIATGIAEYFNNPINLEIIETLRNAGLQLSIMEEETSSSNRLEGMTIVISGTFEHHSRDEYKEIIEREGGKNSGSISKKTSFVLAGENMGPSKLEKCNALGIKILSEDDFLQLISNANGNE